MPNFMHVSAIDIAEHEGIKIPIIYIVKVGKGANIRNRYNQVPHLTQDTNGKVTTSQ